MQREDSWGEPMYMMKTIVRQSGVEIWAGVPGGLFFSRHMKDGIAIVPVIMIRYDLFRTV